MTLRSIIFITTLFLVTPTLGQTRTLTGKIIDQEFNPVYQARIYNADTVLLTMGDRVGNFSLAIPSGTKTLIFRALSMEPKRIELTDSCNNLEIILLSSYTYDFMTPAKVDRLRKKQFNKLPALHQAAFEKGIFETNKPCYVDRFIAYRKEMIKRHKAWLRTHNT
ncbi:carboxypeptidase-like regulatory domain-containing protein [Ferruginibacter sp.]